MFNKSKNNKIEKASYGIVGLGRFGYALAKELAESGADILVMDNDEERVRELRELTENAVVVNALDKKSLEEAGIQNCEVAIVCVGEELDISILTTLNLVSLGIPTVIAKATSSEHGQILEKLGAQVVYPERDMAIRLAHRLESSKTLDFVKLSQKLNISKLIAPEKMIGKTVVEIDLRRKFGLNIIAIENGDDVTEVITPDYVFKTNDILYVAGDVNELTKLSEWSEK